MKTLLLALLAACLASCSTFYDARFAPSPLEVKLADSEVSGLEGRVLITVSGVRRPDSETGRPAQVEVRMRLENVGSVPFSLDAGSLQLSTADLFTLPAGELVPQVPEAVEPGGASEVAVAFPIPPSKSFYSLDWRGLNLRLILRYAERRKLVSASFERLSYYPYGYGYGPYYSMGWGYGGWGYGAWGFWGGGAHVRCQPYVGPFRGY
jgi:hypothetical protein